MELGSKRPDSMGDLTPKRVLTPNCRCPVPPSRECRWQLVGLNPLNPTIPRLASRKSIPAVSVSFTRVGEGSVSSDPKGRIDSLHEPSCSLEIQRYSIWGEETRQARLQTKGCSSKGLSGWPVCLLLALPLLGWGALSTSTLHLRFPLQVRDWVCICNSLCDLLRCLTCSEPAPLLAPQGAGPGESQKPTLTPRSFTNARADVSELCSPLP